MKNFFLTTLFILIGTILLAQNHATSYTECQLSTTEILQQQSFDIDAPISEKSELILFEIYENLNFIYKSEEGDPKRAEYINNFNKALVKARSLDLNLTMFKKDINNISKITP